ncbi:MAG TPA: tetratricopeptide repeat protein [Acidobacteriaceae bacterium]|jgi:Flp pilus assembly protein TadD|nr:tetratricopeptide repeat protein [Acidobacteriaceae bacterium]
MGRAVSSRKAAAKKASSGKPASDLRTWLASHAFLSFALLSAAWVLLLYWRALLNPFSSYDDTTIIVNNPGLASWHGLAYYLRTNVSFVNDLKGSGESYYRPLFWISIACDRKLWGLRPFGFHLTNLLLHWINGLLFFSLLRRLSVPLAITGGAAAIWLAMPINSEAVAWIAARAYGLAAFFLLASAFCALRYLENSGDDKTKRGRQLFALACYFAASLCALLSHEAGILVLPLTALLAYSRKQATAKAALALYGAAAAAAVAYFSLKILIGAPVFQHNPSSPAPFGLFYVEYLGWLLFPLHMSMERSSNTPGGGFSLAAMLAWAGALSILAATALLRRKQPLAAAGLAWMSIALIPFCGVIPIYQGMAERFLYFASAGVALFVAAAVGEIRGRAHGFALAAVAIWVLWGGWRLHARILDWGDSASLYRSSLAASPGSVKLHYNLGAVLENRGELAQAALSYQDTLDLEPLYEPAIAGLGNVRLRQHDLKGAATLYQRALSLKPDDAEALTNYADSLVELGNQPAAEAAYRRAIAIAPSKDDAYNGLGVLLFQEGDALGAAVEFLKAQRVNPSDPTPFYDLGAVYQKLGRLDAAMRLYQKALAVRPGDPDATAALQKLEQRQ